MNHLPLLLLVPLAPFVAQAADRLPPQMNAGALSTAPRIDGQVLGDDAWLETVPATNFWQVQPNDGLPTSQKTEIFIGYTDTAIYVGVVAYDDDPQGIIVSDSRRDSSLNDTDAFLMVIDGLLDRQNGYVFGTNAAGIEYDGQVTKEGAGDNFGSGGGEFNLNWACTLSTTRSMTGLTTACRRAASSPSSTVTSSTSSTKNNKGKPWPTRD